MVLRVIVKLFFCLIFQEGCIFSRTKPSIIPFKGETGIIPGGRGTRTILMQKVSNGVIVIFGKEKIFEETLRENLRTTKCNMKNREQWTFKQSSRKYSQKIFFSCTHSIFFIGCGNLKCFFLSVSCSYQIPLGFLV